MVEYRFLHLLKAERELWREWMKRYGDKWSDYRYDVHVGEGVDVGEGYEEWVRQFTKKLTQKRIDVVAKRQGILWIFEVKAEAGLSAYGQLLAYRELYRKTYQYDREIRLGVVTNNILKDEEWLYKNAGIHVFLVRPAGW
jgi:hypothetical protein